METEVLKIDASSVGKAKNILLGGGLVAFATETVYGLGAIGTNPEAVKKIFEVKGRPTDNPLIAHVHPDYDYENLVYINQPYAKELRKRFTPGPLTMVFESKGVVCPEAVCGGSTLAIRVPSHVGAQALLRAVNAPIVAPSANISKHVSPVTAEHVYKDLNGKIPLILDGGKCSGGIESTVLDVTGKVPRILRAGLITKEMIESVAGACEYAEHKETDAVRSPGVKYSHYMPNCRTARFTENETDKAAALYDSTVSCGERAVILCSGRVRQFFNGRRVINLGETAEEMASNLFYDLRLGEDSADLIIAVEPSGSGGVYDGLLNRLNKAVKRQV